MGAPKTWHKAFRELPASWRMLPYFKRSIMQDLWRLSAPDCSGAFPVAGDPAQFLVRALDLGERHERAKAVKAVRELIEAGLITVSGDLAVIQTASTNTAPLPHQNRADTRSTPREADFRFQIGSGTRANDAESLNGAVQIDRENRVERENAGAQACTSAREADSQDLALTGYRFTGSLLGRSPASLCSMHSQLRDYAWIGARPEAEREAVKRAVEADPWCKANPAYIDGKHLAGRWAKYLAGGPKTVARVDPRDARARLEELRERSKLAHISVNRLKDAPWFDKEADWFPQAVERAEAELAAANAALREAAIAAKQMQVAS